MEFIYNQEKITTQDELKMVQALKPAPLPPSMGESLGVAPTVSATQSGLRLLQLFGHEIDSVNVATYSKKYSPDELATMANPLQLRLLMMTQVIKTQF